MSVGVLNSTPGKVADEPTQHRNKVSIRRLILKLEELKDLADYAISQARSVGASYAEGTGVPKSDVDAAKWFQRAANQGMVFAQLNLGLLYAAGNGVPQDNVEAFKWLELAFFALPTGGPRSDVARAMTDVAAKMTREQIDDAKRRERGWKAQPEVK